MIFHLCIKKELITINLYDNKKDNHDNYQHTGKEGGDITMKSVSGNSGKALSYKRPVMGDLQNEEKRKCL